MGELEITDDEKTDAPLLKLTVYEDGNDQSITYIWGEHGTGRLGINLRWMQAGF